MTGGRIRYSHPPISRLPKIWGQFFNRPIRFTRPRNARPDRRLDWEQRTNRKDGMIGAIFIFTPSLVLVRNDMAFPAGLIFPDSCTEPLESVSRNARRRGMVLFTLTITTALTVACDVR